MNERKESSLGAEKGNEQKDKGTSERRVDEEAPRTLEGNREWLV